MCIRDRLIIDLEAEHTPIIQANSSLMKAVALIEDELACIIGVCSASKSIINVVGVPWLLGTEVIKNNKREFCGEYAKIINQMLSEFSLLENYVDSNNKDAIKFLKRAGFKIGDAMPVGIDGHPFHKFTMGA